MFFKFFFVLKFQPPPPPPAPLKRVTPSFPATPPLKVVVLSSPPFWKIWLEIQPPPPLPPSVERGECTLWSI